MPALSLAPDGGDGQQTTEPSALTPGAGRWAVKFVSKDEFINIGLHYMTGTE